MPLTIAKGVERRLYDPLGSGKHSEQTDTQLLFLNSTTNQFNGLDIAQAHAIGVSQSILAGATQVMVTGLNPPERYLLAGLVIFCLQTTPLTIRDGVNDRFAFGVQGSQPFILMCPTLPLSLQISSGALGINNPSGGAISISWTLFGKFDNG